VNLFYTSAVYIGGLPESAPIVVIEENDPGNGHRHDD